MTRLPRTSLLLMTMVTLFMLAEGMQAAGKNICADPRSLRESIICARQQIAEPGGLVSNQEPSNLLRTIIDWLLSLVAILALLALIVGGVLYIISFGSEDGTNRAKRIILYAIIGLLVVFLSFAILAAIQTLFSPAPAAPAR